MAADLAEAAKLLEYLRAFVNTEARIVIQRGQHRIEVVGFLRNVNDSDTQRPSP
jgi:hypothetical protein